MAEMTELQKDAIAYQRNVDAAKKELATLVEEKKKAAKLSTDKVSGDLKTLDQNIRKREEVLRHNEDEYERRSAALEAREKKVMNLQERETELRKKAIVVETRYIDAKALYEKSVDGKGELDNKLHEIKQKEKELSLREKDLEGTTGEFYQRKDQAEKAEKDFLDQKKSYEMVKKEIDVKLQTIKEKESAIKEREDKISKRELAVVAQTEENRALHEQAASLKDKLDKREIRIRDGEIDLKTKMLRMEK